MNTLKGWITTIFLAATLVASTMTATAGTIIGGRSNTSNICSESGTVKVQETTGDLGGTIIGGLAGTIIGGLTGTIIGGLYGTIIGGVSQVPTVDCGTIIGG
jgi:hypothetical protein